MAAPDVCRRRAAGQPHSLGAQLDRVEAAGGAVHQQQATGQGVPHPRQQLHSLQRLQAAEPEDPDEHMPGPGDLGQLQDSGIIRNAAAGTGSQGLAHTRARVRVKEAGAALACMVPITPGTTPSTPASTQRAQLPAAGASGNRQR